MNGLISPGVGLIALAAASFGVPALALHFLAPTLAKRTTRNFRGREVFLGLGWAWVAWALAIAVSRVAVLPMDETTTASLGRADYALFVLPVGLVLGAFLFGWLDDRFGTGEFRGFKGHLRALAKGRVTTGLLKLVGIGLLAIAYGFAAAAMRALAGEGEALLLRWPLAAVTIAGCANFANLTDLRPGRTLKVYLTLAVVAALAAAGTAVAEPLVVGLSVLVALAGPALAIWPYDLGERGMLGDSGANAAGALAGYMLAISLPVPMLAVVALALVGLNLASERVSFSAVIERTSALRRIDGFGRRP